MQLIVNSAPNPDKATADPYADMREPFQDPALRSLDNLSSTQPSDIFDREKLAKLAMETGLSEVVRWKPRMVRRTLDCSMHVSHTYSIANMACPATKPIRLRP